VKTGRGRFRPKKSVTPVIAGRVPEALYKQIKAAAKQSGRTMSDELAYRAATAFAWEAALGDIRKTQDSAERILEGDARQALRHWGYIEINGSAGSYWMKPGMPPLEAGLNPEFRSELKAAIADVVREAIAETKETSTADSKKHRAGG